MNHRQCIALLAASSLALAGTARCARRTVTESRSSSPRTRSTARSASSAPGSTARSPRGSRERLPPQPPARERLAAIGIQLDELKARAILEPSPENVTAYVRFQRSS
jgi:conjugal transfer pilus assembly protein TraF